MAAPIPLAVVGWIQQMSSWCGSTLPGVAHAACQALVVTGGGEIDFCTVDRFRAGIAAGF